MTPLVFFLILAIILGVALGILIGMFIANRRSMQAPESVPADETTQPALQHAEELPIQVSEVSKEGFQSILHLWRHDKSSELAIDIDGSFHVKPQTITQEERQQLCVLADEWREWLCKPGDIALSPSSTAEPSRPEIEVDEQSPADIKPETDLMPFESEIEPLRDAKPAAPSPAKPSKEAVPEPLSIVAQIDEILQEMLKRSPLDQRGIRLSEDPDRGVVVWVGLERYSGIDEVPMKDVQGILRAAVAEWERRSELKGQTP